MTVATETNNGGTAAKRIAGKRATSETTVTTPLAMLPAARPSASAKPPSKSATVIKLLSRPKGATGPEITTATDWQPHSVRSYLTGLRKKGHTLVREARKTGEQSYRLVAAVTSSDARPSPKASDQKTDSANLPSADGANAGAGPADADAATVNPAIV